MSRATYYERNRRDTTKSKNIYENNEEILRESKKQIQGTTWK